MLKRDLPNDYCQKYLDQANKQTFYKSLQERNSTENLYLTSRQLQVLGEESKKTTRMIQGAGTLSVLAFLMFNKLPVLGSIQSRFMKVTTRLGILVGPVMGVLNFQVQKIQHLKNLFYEEQAFKYKNFLRSGDFQKLNQEIELCQQ